MLCAGDVKVKKTEMVLPYNVEVEPDDNYDCLDYDYYNIFKGA